MSRIPFHKLHGLGNDFVVLDGLTRQLPVEALADVETARRLCHRHRGIGADGLLLVLPPLSLGADARMRVINADGSEAEMCGNGIRCVAKWMHDHLPQFSGRESLALDTGAGLLACKLALDSDGHVSTVEVDMGPARLDRAQIPMLGEGRFVEQPIEVGERTLLGTGVSMGNPHLVFFVEDEDPHELALELGPRLEHHPLFPHRTNVEMARPRPDGLELWVWERGCGLTQACGTGACATAAAAVLTGRHPVGQPLRVELPGGALTVVVQLGFGSVLMEGPAEEVFAGEMAL